MQMRPKSTTFRPNLANVQIKVSIHMKLVFPEVQDLNTVVHIVVWEAVHADHSS